MDLTNPLQPLHDLDRTSPQFHKQLSEFLRGNEYRNVLSSLQKEDLVWLVEYLDSVLVSSADSASVPFQESLHELKNICGIKGVLPKSWVLPASVLNISLPSTSSCVYEGSLDGSKVRIRRVEAYSEGGTQSVKETFYQVAVVWRHLTHPNVAPLLGVTTDPLQLISNDMPGGDLTKYITDNPAADRLSLLSDIAQGLNYLHSCNMVHGDLKGQNVFVDATGRARVTDFGLAMVTRDLASIRSASDEHEHSARWIAPEILDDRGIYSKETDVFSFAMVTIEVFTGAVPFSDKSPHAAMLMIAGGERPPRPTHPALTDALWSLTQRCWDQDALRRPQGLQILRSLIPTWKCLINCPLGTSERISLITDIFSDRNETEMVKRLCRDDAQSFVDVVVETLDSLISRVRKECLRVLCRICGRHALLPRSLRIPLCYDRSEDALYQGGYADVWMGEHQGRKVAVKVLRVYSRSNLDKIINSFCKEVVTWKTLCHPNVLPLMGVMMNINRFAMVSEWMTNGNINEFIRANVDVNRFELLGDVSRGLIYMHGEGMIHGDLKGVNILVDQGGHARLADFGLLTIVSDPTNLTTSSSSKTGTLRWTSPEILDPERFGFKKRRSTRESDCYALGMVVLEVLTGKIPFPLYANMDVMRKVLDGERPGRPQGAEAVWFTDNLWGMLERCWSPQPNVRPTVEAVLECFKHDSMDWTPLPPSAEDDLWEDSDGETVLSVYSAQTVPQGSDQSPVLSHSVDASRNSS